MDSAFRYVIALTKQGANLDLENCYVYHANVRLCIVDYIVALRIYGVNIVLKIIQTSLEYSQLNDDFLILYFLIQKPFLLSQVCLVNQTSSCAGSQDVGFVDIKKGNETDLQVAVATIGPVSVAIDASNPSFQMYR